MSSVPHVYLEVLPRCSQERSLITRRRFVHEHLRDDGMQLSSTKAWGSSKDPKLIPTSVAMVQIQSVNEHAVSRRTLELLNSAKTNIFLWDPVPVHPMNSDEKIAAAWLCTDANLRTSPCAFQRHRRPSSAALLALLSSLGRLCSYHHNLTRVAVCVYK